MTDLRDKSLKDSGDEPPFDDATDAVGAVPGDNVSDTILSADEVTIEAENVKEHQVHQSPMVAANGDRLPQIAATAGNFIDMTKEDSVFKIASAFKATKPELPRQKSVLWTTDRNEFSRFPPGQNQLFGLRPVRNASQG